MKNVIQSDLQGSKNDGFIKVLESLSHSSSANVEFETDSGLIFKDYNESKEYVLRDWAPNFLRKMVEN